MESGIRPAVDRHGLPPPELDGVNVRAGGHQIRHEFHVRLVGHGAVAVDGDGRQVVFLHQAVQQGHAPLPFRQVHLACTFHVVSSF